MVSAVQMEPELRAVHDKTKDCKTESSLHSKFISPCLVPGRVDPDLWPSALQALLPLSSGALVLSWIDKPLLRCGSQRPFQEGNEG